MSVQILYNALKYVFLRVLKRWTTCWQIHTEQNVFLHRLKPVIALLLSNKRLRMYIYDTITETVVAFYNRDVNWPTVLRFHNNSQTLYSEYLPVITVTICWQFWILTRCLMYWLYVFHYLPWSLMNMTSCL